MLRSAGAHLRQARRSFSAAPLDVVRQYDLNIHKVPRLPVPTVEQTMTRYLETMRPLLNDSDYERTVRLTNDFVKSDTSKTLQEQVLKVAKGEGYPYHYFEDAWDDMY
jgi:hypothetical protein